jgi:DNA-binding CsgD family transcriptional regulator
VLDVFGGDDLPSRVYGMLVRRPRARSTELAAELDTDVDGVVDVLRALASDGLAVRIGVDEYGEWEAQSPHEVADALLSAQEDRLATVRRHSRTLAELYWLARRDVRHLPGVEVVRDRALVAQRYLSMQDAADTCFRVFERPPYHGDADPAFVVAQARKQAERMDVGVEYRRIYEDSVFEHPGSSTTALRRIERGEQARSLPSLPMKLAVSDESLAMLPLDPTDLIDGATLVVHPSGLLTALVSVFDILWRMAVPMSGRDRDGGLTERDRAILTMMSSGATDETIARRLDMSRRTVVRHTSALLERLGATTRFQAGVQAARLGWL